MILKYWIAPLLVLGLFTVVPAQESPVPLDSVPADSTQADSIFPPAPVSMLTAADSDNDHGHSIKLSWELSADDGAGQNSVLTYEVFRWTPFFMDTVKAVRDGLTQMAGNIAELQAFLPRAEKRLKLHRKGETGVGFADSVQFYLDTIAASEHWLPIYRERLDQLHEEQGRVIDLIPQAHKSYPEQGEWDSIGTAVTGQTDYVDVGVKERESPDYMADHTDYYYRVEAVTIDPSVRTSSEPVGPVQCYGQFFNTGRWPVFVAVLVFGFLTIFFVARARKGADLYVRPLAGIDAVDDAIGRATEMGKPILYVLGLGTAADIGTIASFTILGRVAKKVAEYQTKLIVPCYDPIVMTVAQETVKAAYLDAGRPDDYDEDIVYFVTQSQFAYVAAVNGTMLRELPATNMYMGVFHAESLILAETGALAGSIQIAGTDQVAQLPFFIVACDYTLIGEELYAASAYLGREPILLGSLKAQDYAKAAVIILAVLGLLAASLDWMAFVNLFSVTS
ncbi:MAG: DUF6754 domain-containing protein [bacterium]